MSLSPVTSSPGRSSARRRSTLAVASLLALGAATLPATAEDPCLRDHLVACGVDNDATSALPVSATSINTIVFPRNDNDGLAQQLYASLIPTKYSMPSSQQIAVQLTRFDLGRCRTVPGQPTAPCSTTGQAGTTSWIESSIAIRVANGATEGWYPLSVATSSAVELNASRAAGIPAYTATGDLVAKTGGFLGTAAVGSRKAISLDFVEDKSVAFSQELTDLANYAAPVYGVTSIFTGTTRWRTARSLRPVAPVRDISAGTQTSELKGVNVNYGTQKGVVSLTLDGALNTLDSASPSPLPDVPLPAGRTLADLITLERVALDALVRTEDGYLVTQRENLDNSESGLRPSAPGTANVFATVPANQAFATTLVAITKGSATTFINADTTGQHTVTSVALDSTGAPLFDGTAAGGEVVAVKGTEKLVPGTYAFICALHPGNMQGSLVVD